MLIPVLALMLLVGLIAIPFAPTLGAVVAAAPLAATLLYLTHTFGGIGKALPRWAARWILIWPYSVGIVKGLLQRIT